MKASICDWYLLDIFYQIFLMSLANIENTYTL
jgi:hypothetical protein